MVFFLTLLSMNVCDILFFVTVGIDIVELFTANGCFSSLRINDFQNDVFGKLKILPFTHDKFWPGVV
jgi:hypothetical protein